MIMKDNISELLNKKEPEGINEYGKPYRVLIVDDSTTMRKIVGQQLKSELYEVCGEASNGVEALQKYRDLNPDIVTLDINMPIANGIEALKAILNYNQHAKVVMLTSEGEKNTVLEALRLGAKGYIVKPPKKSILCERVKIALESN